MKGLCDLKKKQVIEKAVSLTAAAALSCTSMIGSGVALTAADKPAEERTELVPVIIKVNGDAVLTTPEGMQQGADFLDTDQAVRMSNGLKSTQTYVQNQIRQLYPALKVGYSYSILYNGFSCEVPANLMDDIAELPYVVNVAEVQEHNTPKMADASVLAEIPAYYDATGCYGEGTVIAVIDSELDYTHPMFSALDEGIETALTQENIAEIASSIGFNVDIDPQRAYRSNKLPYVVDYVDDPYDGVWNNDEYAYHGTHVSGIAAGNAYVTAEGRTISGVAKNAQLVFMAVGKHDYYIDDAAALAATEDAVKLHADVINMSYGMEGEPFGNDPCAEAYAAAEHAGVVICNASGNYAEGTLYGGCNYTEDPDVSTTNRVPAGTKIFTIASADNPHTQSSAAFETGGELVAYTETYWSLEEEPYYIGDRLQGEYAYVYCGQGMPEDFEGVDLTGKIALCEQSDDIMFNDTVALAQEAGAVAVLFFTSEGVLAELSFIEGDIPAALFNHEDGMNMVEAEDKTVRFNGDFITKDMPTAVSDYTSWGVKQCLELEPDIMGVGGYVESAAYGDGTGVLSGTSMATPYMSGCVAIMTEYMRKQGIMLEDSEKIAYIRNLLMNSAVPYTDADNLFASPRRQGAGLVDMNRMLADKVIMTNPGNDAKINLYDNIGDAFGFDVVLSNLSGEDVNFASARLVLTTNDYYYDDKMEHNCIHATKQIMLDCTADVSALTSVAAGSSRTEHVNVSLNPSQTAALREVYTNGFFVEGYLLLEGAENCCDISIPVLGFHGDWAQVPILDDYAPAVYSMGEGAVLGGFSMAKVTDIVKEVLAQIPEEELTAEDVDFIDLFLTYADEEQVNAIWEEPSEEYFISPNGDGLADGFGINAVSKRFYQGTGLRIYNEAGELVSEGKTDTVDYKWYPNTWETGVLDGLADGVYTAELLASIDYASSYANPQRLSYAFTIDRHAPEVKTSVREEDGRQILTLTAMDDNLDGIFITGTGTGALYGEDIPEISDAPYELLAPMYAMELKGEWSTFARQLFDADDLPLIGKMMAGAVTDADYADTNFMQAIVAEPDENGVFTIEYDITELSSYSFAVTDKAYQITEFASEDVPAKTIRPGIYTSQSQVYAFTEDSMTAAAFQDGASHQDDYTFADGQITIGSETAEVYQVNSRTIRLVHADGTAELLRWQGEGTLEDYLFYTTDQIAKRVGDVAAMLFPMFEITRMETSFRNGIVTVNLYMENQGKEELLLSVQVDNLTGVAYIPDAGEELSLWPITMNDMAYDVWMEIGNGGLYYWNFNNGSITAQEDGAEKVFSFTVENTELMFDIDGVQMRADAMLFDDSTLMLTWEDGSASLLNYVGVPETFRFYTTQQLCTMAADYYTIQNGTAPELTEAAVNEEGEIIIQLSEDECYSIDPMTGIGLDQDGEAVDLTSVLAPMENPFTQGVWFAYGLEGRYLVFTDDHTGEIRFMEDGDSAPFTYEMKADGAVFHIESEENVSNVQLWPQEDGSVLIGWDAGFSEVAFPMGYAADFSFYTFDELASMAQTYANADAYVEETYPDGTVCIAVYDANGGLTDMYTVDPVTAEGVNLDGMLISLAAPELPKDAYDLEELCEMALTDYEKKNGVRPANATAVVHQDGTVSIQLTDTAEDGQMVLFDCYTVDPVTGEGTNSAGEAVDLPQTGNNAPQTAAVTGASVLMMVGGFFAMLRSGILRRKHTEEQ